MPVNKVKYGKKVLLDLTADTVTAGTLAKGYTAHNKAGSLITGTLEPSGGEPIPDKPVAGDNAIYASQQIAKTLAPTMLATGIKVGIDKAGTYRFTCSCINTNPSATDAKKVTSAQLFKNGKAEGGELQVNALSTAVLTRDVACVAGDEVEVYAREAHGNNQFPFYILGFFASIVWPSVGSFMHVIIPDPHDIPEWVQPEASNPYNKGDKVRHNGKIWISFIDRNIWEPGVYGWNEVSK